MLAQVGEEAIEDGFCGNGETNGEGILGLWYTADRSYLVKVIEMKFGLLQQLLDGGGTEST